MTDTLIPYSFIPGTKAKASEVNANFIAVADNISTLTTTVETKLNKDLSNINSAGLEFIKNNSASPRNIGEIITSTIPLTDADLHLLDGALISGSGSYSAFVDYIAGLVSNYPDLFETEANWQISVNTYGVCGKFVYDSTNNTVRLPKITGKLDGTNDGTALGDLAEQYVKLPNITGSFRIGDNSDSNYWGRCWSATGAFNSPAVYHTYGNYDNGSNETAGGDVYLDASRSSSVYSGNGTNTTIHEQAINVFYYIVIATSTKTDIQVDIDEVATDLNGKADTDLANTTNQAKILMSGMGMPSNRYINLTLGASGAEYTAPANGYYVVAKTSTGANQYLYMATEVLRSQIWATGSNLYLQNYMPIKKGEKIVIAYTTGGATEVFTFVYAQGSESEAQ